MKKFLFMLFCFLVMYYVSLNGGEFNSPFSLRKVSNMEKNNCKYCNVNVDFVIARNNYHEYERLVEEFTNAIASMGSIERDNMNVSEFWCSYVDHSEIQMEELEEIPF